METKVQLAGVVYESDSLFLSATFLKALLFAIPLYHIICYIYNIYFHPLRHFPGPWTWAASRIPHEWVCCRGDIDKVLSSLHDKYGEVVRVGPNSLSFVHPDAWDDIYNRKPDQPRPLQRDPKRYTKGLWIHGAPDIWSSPDQIHPHLRKALTPLFSDKALRSYEPIINYHADRWILRLKELTSGKGPGGDKINIGAWVSFISSDTICDLAFGEPFGCIDTGKLHPWLSTAFESGRAVVILGAIRQFPWINGIIEPLLQPFLEKAMTDLKKLAVDKIDRRLQQTKARDDFIEVLNSRVGQPDGFTLPELYSNVNFLILAGSETSSTCLNGALYHMCANPRALKAVQDEIRQKYSHETDITFESLKDVPVLTAALREGIRLYPGSNTNPRITPEGGATVGGHWVPEATSVNIFQTVAYHDSHNFQEPYKYDPGRFLEDPRYATDRLDAFRPFGVGPKNCIGDRLAYLQMKMVLAKLIWHFDLELCPEADGWLDQDMYLLPRRKPLMVRMKAVH